MSQELKSIDLYAGVGGWSLGLRMAEIEVVCSYERWAPANKTNRINNGHTVAECDVRHLDPSTLPNVPIIVGSPPCTQFSLSNRGGRGDVSDGLEDIAAFLRIVEDRNPRWWVMENVPAIARIFARELLRGGRLYRFRHLRPRMQVFDMADFGLPQRRRRCLIGNIDFDLLGSYSRFLPRRTLGDVLDAVGSNLPVDPIYGVELSRSDLFDHVPEQFLNIEEERINRAAKTLHPIYNSMSFPDRVDRPVRTITATCTRVSRESIIVEAPERPGGFRRLTIRERALAQGFPITFQFFGSTHSQKQKMVGNALPPLFAFYVAHAMKGTAITQLPSPAGGLKLVLPCTVRPPLTGIESPSFKYPAGRRFRFAIPALRMKSGMRFELTNGPAGSVDWHVLFVFGTSKNIRSLRADKTLLATLRGRLPGELWLHMVAELSSFEDYLRTVDSRHLQAVWSHTGPGLTRPFILLDEISSAGERLTTLIEPFGAFIQELVGEALCGANADKAKAHAARILAGLFVAAITNEVLSLGSKPVLNRMNSPPRERSTA